MESQAPTLDVNQLNYAILSAIEAAQVGFYFEEGGCWGFAAALHDFFTERGIPATIQVQRFDFVHAWVNALGQSWDHQGLRTADGMCYSDVARDEIASIASQYGVDQDTLDCDIDEAKDILANVPDLMG